MSKREHTMSAQEMAVCMGTDAMRLCLGLSPRNFKRRDVLRWIRQMSRR